MSTEATRELLVVGAGPVGLVTALLGARAGLDVQIIDQEWRIAARNYACVLHPASLTLLDQLGVAGKAIDLGVKLQRIAFYEGPDRKAEVDLSKLDAPHPFALALYQDDLEGLLEDTLRDRHACKVEWGRRLDSVEWQEDRVTAVLERLQHSPTGDPSRKWEEVVDRRGRVTTRFLVGADGPRSRVAHVLGTTSETVGEPATYAIYEFEPLSDAGTEMRVALDTQTMNILWPLPGGTCRWTLESPEPAGTGDAEPAHETIKVLEAPVGSGGRRGLEVRIRQVAPWFTSGVHHLDWAMRLEFPRRVTHQFGRGCCWLLGDSAHQAPPGGAHSMNVALLEAADWVAVARGILRSAAPASQLTDFSARWRTTWKRLMGITPALRASPGAAPWVQTHAGRILPCLPATGSDLDALLAQLGLGWA